MVRTVGAQCRGWGRNDDPNFFLSAEWIQ
jgi:hypothetical protein